MPDETFAEFNATLRDGRVVHLRAIRATDEAELLQAFDRLSPDARYMRFMHAIRENGSTSTRCTLPRSAAKRAITRMFFVVAGRPSG